MYLDTLGCKMSKMDQVRKRKIAMNVGHSGGGPALWKLRWEDLEFKANLGFILRP